VKLGVLETGAPPENLRPKFGDYPGMFRSLLGEGYDWRVYDLQAGRFPERAEDNDAYLITGSSSGVYEPDPWIGRLIEFLRQAKGRTKLVGICFGHQAMAEAFGGKVVKSPKGWGIGLHAYDVQESEPWMDPAKAVALPASHQDQVVDLPPAARILASSAFTPYAMLEYGDQPAISIQPHPEFDPAFAEALIENRRGTRFTEAEADAGVASLRQPNDRARVGEWIGRFLAGR
jgi:GMP synthase-like glutamine amidotransferase